MAHREFKGKDGVDGKTGEPMPDAVTNEAKHTPGPWYAKATDGYDHCFRIRDNRDRGNLATVHFAGMDTLANANLIAAAPDLLAALRAMLHMHEHLTSIRAQDIVSTCETARAAIAKAEVR